MDEASQVTGRDRGRRVLLPVGLAVVTLAADQLTKWLVAAWLGPGQTDHRVDVVGRLVAIHYVENRGVAFGLFQGQAMLATAMALLVLVFLARAYRESGTASWRVACGCGLIVGGAIGNLSDRLR